MGDLIVFASCADTFPTTDYDQCVIACWTIANLLCCFAGGNSIAALSQK